MTRHSAYAVRWVRRRGLGAILVLAGMAGMGVVSARSADAPAVVVGGSADVQVGDKPAVSVGDTVSSGDVIVSGSSNVFINGKPAVTAGDKTSCGGVVIGGSSNVFVNGKPLASSGDVAAACPD